MNLYTSLRTCCLNCSDKAAEDCYGCVVGTHMCCKPEQDCLKEDTGAL